MPRRTSPIFLEIAALLSLPRLCEAQCQRVFTSTICPAADRIYINTEKKLAALRLSDGSIEWQVKISETEAEEDFTGTAATANTVAVFVGVLGARIYAFDPKTGATSWHIQTSSGDLISVGPYFVFSDREHWEALTAVDDRTGKRIWHHSGSRPTRGGVAFRASSERAIVTDRFAIDASLGKILRRWPPAWEVYAAAIGEKFVAIGTSNAGPNTNKLAVYSLPDYAPVWVKDSPQGREIAGVAVDSDHVFAAVNPTGWQFLHPGQIELELLAVTSGEPIWTKTISSGGPLASPVGLSHGVAVFATDETATSDMVQGFDATTGQLRWTVRTDHRIDGITCMGSTCYVAGEIGEVLAVDAETGAQRWYRIPTQ
jgi:outer membrane protein assembly factor BamB